MNFPTFDELMAQAVPVPPCPRRVNPNSLLGLLWQLRAKADNFEQYMKAEAFRLDKRIKGLERRLEAEGIPTAPLIGARDVAALLKKRGAKGHCHFLA